MKCPKCNYTSFDYLDNCKQCGADLGDVRSLLQIIAVSPEDQAPPAPIVAPEVPSTEETTVPPESDVLSADDGAGADVALDTLDFDGSFDDLVEHTSYASEGPESAVTETPRDSGEGQEEELLDLDFGDLFEEEEEP